MPSGADQGSPITSRPLVPYTAGTPSSLALSGATRQPSGPAVVELGTGQFVNPVSDGSQSRGDIVPNGPDVTLDFVAIDVRDVARSVLGNLLHVSYVVDPAVQANVTLQTGQPIPRARVLPTLVSALQVSGVALIVRDNVYRLVPIANAPHEAALSSGAGIGFVTRAVTPQYVAATDLQHVLEPLLPPATSVQADASRNVLIVSGPDSGVADVLRDVSAFDVDYMRGMSFALLPLRNAQARDVAREIASLLGNGRGSLTGLVNVQPIDRLNAVMVTAMQPTYLARVRTWVDQLDRGGSGSEQRLYVYRVQNGRASDLASVLRRAMGIESSGPPGGPGRNAGPIDASFDNGSAGSASSGGALGRAPSILLDALPGTASAAPLPGQIPGPPPATGGPGPIAGADPMFGGRGPSSGASPTGVRINADENNNALVITGTADDYARIAAALQKLDVTPLQVMVDATIAEVTLTNQLQYGLEYYIRAGDFRALLSSPSSAGTTAANGASTANGGISPVSAFQGFNFIPGLNVAVTGASGTAVILQALSQLTRVQVLSSPNLLVLNNQPARIQVGDQVPIATQSAVSTLSPGAPQVNSIEYRDTGVILTITPRVNASGLVLLDISEEVSSPSTTTTSSIASPTISQRRVVSSVAVSDGQTVALGGLIQDARNTGKDGIPVLQDIPVLGWLFGTRTNSLTRTELIVLITPHVVRNGGDAQAVTDELRQKLPLTVPALSKRGG